MIWMFVSIMEPVTFNVKMQESKYTVKLQKRVNKEQLYIIISFGIIITCISV